MQSSKVRHALPRFLFPKGCPGGAAADFHVNNLPYGVFKPKGGDARIGVAVGDKVLDLRVLVANGLLPDKCGLSDSALNNFMASGKAKWQEVRHELQKTLLSDENPKNLSACGRLEEAIHASNAVEMLLPANIGDYTDFYASREHATNVGKMFRPTQDPLLPNWLHIPVGYHGRASTVVVSGTPVRRPKGQQVVKGQDAGPPFFGPEKLLDIELEMGCFVGPGNELGESIPLDKAEDHIFGLVVFNDWSARSIQKWEYVPLGPFLGKNFLSTVSPWVVTLDALEPFRTATPEQGAGGDPKPLPYLTQAPESKQTWDIKLDVEFQAPEMSAPETVARSNLKWMYWSLAQQLTHHCVNGCKMNPGDLLGTGTISGPEPENRGSFLELCWRGEKEIKIDGGKIVRKFLQDGDKINLRGFCDDGNGTRVGFGECSGVILPSN